MKTGIISFYIKAPAEELIKLLKPGEQVNVKILEKTGENLYTVNLKGRSVEALSNLRLPRGAVVTLRVESTKPRVVLRLIRIKSREGYSKALKLPEQADDEKSLKEIIALIKHSETLAKSETSRGTTPLFLPVFVFSQDNSKIGELLISAEAKKTKRGKQLYRITILAGPFKWGKVKINALSVDTKTRLILSVYSKEGYELLSRHINQLSSVSHVKSLFLHLAKEEPTIRRRVDIKA